MPLRKPLFRNKLSEPAPDTDLIPTSSNSLFRNTFLQIQQKESLTDVIIFLVITLLCLTFQPTRLFGFVGLAILCLTYPFLLIAVGTLSLVAYVLIRYYKRRKDELPRLPERGTGDGAGLGPAGRRAGRRRE